MVVASERKRRGNSVWAAAVRNTLSTGRNRKPVAIFHPLLVCVLLVQTEGQLVINGKDKFDHN